MVEHDEYIGKILAKLDELGIADDTMIRGFERQHSYFNTWPDAAITPFRSEKNTNWEGAFRVPAFVRWPGKVPAGRFWNGIFSHQDWLPTRHSPPPVCRTSQKSGTAPARPRRRAEGIKVHIDGYNMLPVPDRAGKARRKESS